MAIKGSSENQNQQLSDIIRELELINNKAETTYSTVVKLSKAFEEKTLENERKLSAIRDTMERQKSRMAKYISDTHINGDVIKTHGAQASATSKLLEQSRIEVNQAAIKEVEEIVKSIKTNTPQLIEAGITLFMALIENMPAIISGIVAAIPQIITGIVGAFTAAGPQLLESGVSLITQVGDGMLSLGSWIFDQAVSLIGKALEGFSSMGESLLNIGKDIVDGLWKGLQGAWGTITDGIGGLVGGAVDGLKGLLGIGSPSKVMQNEVGVWIPAGIAAGIEEGMPAIYNAVDDVDAALSTIGANMAITTRLRAAADTSGALLDSIDMLRTSRDNLAVNVYLQGEARDLWRVVRTENNKRTRATAYNALAQGV